MDSSPELEAELRELQTRLSALQARLNRSFQGGRAPGSTVEVLLVEIGNLSAAFELDSVREVVPVAALRPIPEAPAWVLGALNLRGKTTPVVHIGSKLAGGSTDFQLEDLIVIAETDLGTAGFIVSSVGTIVETRLDETASLNETPHASYVVGTFSFQGNTRLLLGIAELLQHTDLRSVDRKKEREA